MGCARATSARGQASGPTASSADSPRLGDYSIVYNCNGRDAEAIRAVREGRAAPLWQTSIPAGDPVWLIGRRR